MQPNRSQESAPTNQNTHLRDLSSWLSPLHSLLSCHSPSQLLPLLLPVASFSQSPQHCPDAGQMPCRCLFLLTWHQPVQLPPCHEHSFPWSHQDEGRALTLLLLARACQAGLHPPGMDTCHSPWEQHHGSCQSNAEGPEGPCTSEDEPRGAGGVVPVPGR